MDDNQNGYTPAAASSAAANTIPQERLNAEIDRRRELERQLHFTQQQVTQLVQQRQVHARPEVPDAEFERLRAESPAVAERMLKMQRENKQLRAGLFSSFDKQDRLEFVQEFGEGGKKRLRDVEQILENERQKGNHNANRQGIYVWLMGQERLRKDAEAPRTQAATQSTQVTHSQAQDDLNAPGSDPVQAATIRSGTAGKDSSQLSFEEREKLIENEVF